MIKDDTGISDSVNPGRKDELSGTLGSTIQPEDILNYHRRIKRGILVCLLITYLVPVVILTVYFNNKFNSSMRESGKMQLAAVAESKRNTIDLFMQTRIVNVFNLFHMKDFSLRPSLQDMQAYLENLIRSDDAFLDVGIIDPEGNQIGYAGPYPHLRSKNYSDEKWYINLIDQERSYIITDLYLGLRRHLHFTIGVKQVVDGRYYVIRTSVYPDKLYDLINVSYGKKARGFIVNEQGLYQVVDKDFGKLLEPAFYAPGTCEKADVTMITLNGESTLAAHTWLKEVPWCLVLMQDEPVAFAEMYGVRNTMIIGAALLIMVITLFIWIIVNRLLSRAQAVDLERVELKSQLYHAHKLVSVGQLAGGVAHEINNPLAIIESESGVIRDMFDPELGMDASPDAIRKELDEIDKAVSRARGITQKILSFVRKTEPKLEKIDINQLLDEVASGVKEQEFKVSDISLIKDYAPDIPEMYLDPDLMRQVFLNLMNNASDAVGKNDTITLKTAVEDNHVKIIVSDTGKGIAPDQLEKIFMPFFTTKNVGKGTGLGLPISLNIVEGFGGRMEVKSMPGTGTAFTIVLPLPNKDRDTDGYQEKRK
ncbi:MAG: histidine kinase [Deltaproteobacteria bacterium]|nr:histidine kinase [Deltaproteobacteria bacterium]